MSFSVQINFIKQLETSVNEMQFTVITAHDELVEREIERDRKEE